MADRREFVNRVLRKYWNDTTNIYKEYNASGVETLSRAYNATDLTDKAIRVANDAASTVQTKALQAIQINKTFNAIVSPTNADVVAEVQALARQMNGVIKLVTSDLSDTSGT